jgi:hypothetical protein
VVPGAAGSSSSGLQIEQWGGDRIAVEQRLVDGVEAAWLIISAALMFLGLIFSGIIDTFWGYWVGKGVLILFSAGWTWLGYALWSEGIRPSDQPCR